MEKKTEDLILEARNFFDSYKKEIGKSVREGRNVISIDFNHLSEFSPELSELLFSSPEEILQVLEVALEESGLIKNPRVRLLSMPENYSEKIRNLRAKHLNKLIQIDGIVRQASEVRPQVVNAKFECPSCGTILSVLQIESKFREPSRCSCGRKGGFKLISKDMVDAQRLVIEESSESLTGGEQPRRISVFLKEDLVEPKMEEKTTPGSRVRVTGILKEIPRLSQAGGILTRYDIALEANNLISLEETFDEFDISEEDERQIKELTADPKLLEKFIESIAPSIYGYEEIKKSLVLQLFGGIKKIRSDGTRSRGDIHVLLVGDPGVAKSIGRHERILYYKNKECGYETIEKLFEKFGGYPKNFNVLTINQEKHNSEWCNVKEIIKHLPEKKLIKVTTEHGKKIIATKDHSFITLSKEGKIIPIKGEKLTLNSYLPLPINFHKKVIKEIKTKEFNTYKTNSRQLLNKLKLDKDFGFFTGIFLSEGNINGKKEVVISSKNEKIKENVKRFAKKIGLNPRCKEKGVSIPSKSLSNLLNFYCYKKDSSWINTKIKGNYSRIKKIPEFSYFSDKEFIKGLLSGIFSGDGRFIKDRTKIKGVELITVSKELAQGTSDILFSIGIINRIISRQYKYKSKRTDYFTVQIPNYMLSLFLKEVEFFREKLKFSAPIYSYHDLIPCGDLVYSLVKKLRFNSRINGDRTFAAEMRTVKARNEIGRLRLLRILKNLPKNSKKIEEFGILKKIANSPIVWSKVEKIEEIKSEKEEVYDISIPKTNTFVANGIGIHNSQILKFISIIAPKGRYMAGRGTSGAGLTATVVRDEFLRGWSLEAGAMVLANKGIVCILPDSNIILDNKILPIKELFDEKNKKIFFSKGEKIEVCDINSEVPSLIENTLESKNIKASMLRRKLYKGRIIKIYFDSGFSLSLTPEHKLIDGNELKWKEAKEFKTGDFLVAPLKLPENNSDIYILDIIPSDWIVCLKKKEKEELKKLILLKYRNLKEFNKKYKITRQYFSGGKQLKIDKFKRILNEFNIYEDWKKRGLVYGRAKAGEKLKIEKITPELSYFIGFVYGDGNIKISKRHSIVAISQSTKNKKQIENLKRFFKEFSNRVLNEFKRISRSVIRGKEIESENLSLYSNSNLLAYLCNFFLRDNLSNILKLPDNCINAFVAGAMDSDGCISIKNSQKNNKNYKMVDVEFFLSNNERACKNFILALRRLDCYAKLIENKQINKIRITGRSDIEILLKAIYKYSVKIKELPIKKLEISSASNKLPLEIVSQICSEIIRECENTGLLNKFGLSSTIYDYKNKKRQPSREQLIKISKKLDFISKNLKERINILGKRDFFIDKIKEIKEENYEGYVYDLFVPDTHNFVCEGVIVHNCLDEIEKMDEQDRSAMHEAMEQQCYLPDFEITFADNSKTEIGIFVDSLIEKNKEKTQKGINCEILHLNKKTEILTTDFESIYPVKINRVSRHIAPDMFVKIKLSNGREITVTPEHPCWSMEDGKITTTSAQNLKPGSFFPIPGELPIEGETQFLDLSVQNGPRLCKLLGYHITDGCYELNRGKKNGIQFCNNDKKLIGDYFSSIKEVFNITPIITKRDKQFAVRVISNRVVEFFNYLDKSLMEKGKLKKIPDIIMKCKKEDMAFLLRSIFDGDGTVVNVKRNGCRITLISENIKLAEQVSELLLRFGILSSIYQDKEFFRIDICGQENLIKFYENIGFLSEKKQNRLKGYLSKQKTYRSISDIIPGSTNTIKRIFKHLRINEEKYLGNQICMNCNKHRIFLQKMIKIAEEKINELSAAKEIVKNTSNSKELGEIRKELEFSLLYISKKLGISDYTLEQNEKRNVINEKYKQVLLSEIEFMLSILPELREIKKLAFGKIRWSKIKSVEIIKNKGVKWVYDIAVEPTHAFISNNMILHNSVTISKANVQASLRAETSVLAAGNPKFGRFDPYQTVASQIDIPPTLINRFDIIFILKDIPERARDEAIATHVLLEHQQPEIKTPIEKELMKKYIAYAKQKISPKLTDEVVDEIKKFYVDLRNTPVSIEQPTKPLPISARQLEALIRLSEASAKLRLSKKITKQDAKIAIDLMKFYLMQVGYDYETKTFDIDRIASGVSTSQRGKILLVRETLARLESRLGKLIPVEELKKELESKMEDKDVDESLDKLTISGDIFHPRKGFVQRM